MIPLLAAAATPLIQNLMKNGLSALAGAVANKGKEYVEEKLGVKIPEQIDDKLALSLKQLEFDHAEELERLALEGRKLDLEELKVSQGAVTERWQADMLSDSWLSKNIRPMVLIFLLGAYSLFSVASAFSLFVTQAYVELLGQMLMLVISAYFAGRTVEKVVDMKERGKQ
jgi:hypothetical protein